MAFVVFIPALLNEEATDAPAHGDDLARRHTADLRSVGASWLRCMLGLAADAAAHILVPRRKDLLRRKFLQVEGPWYWSEQDGPRRQAASWPPHGALVLGGRRDHQR